MLYTQCTCAYEKKKQQNDNCGRKWKKICASYPKNIRIREKIGDLTMKTNFIWKCNQGTKNCIFWSI